MAATSNGPKNPDDPNSYQADTTKSFIMKMSSEKLRETETNVSPAIFHFYIPTFLSALHSVVMEDYMHAMQRKYD